MFSQMFDKIFLEIVNELQVKKSVVYDDVDLPTVLINVVSMEISNSEIIGSSSLKVWRPHFVAARSCRTFFFSTF